MNELDLKLMSLYLSSKKKMFIDKLRCVEDKKRSICSELLVRWLINKRLHLKNEEIHFEYNEFGKPFLKEYEKFYFNISHSGEWIVCAVSPCEVGIDIEQIKDINLLIANRFFSKKENIDLNYKNEDDKLDYFYDLWTLKESYLKYLGKGLSISLQSFSIRKERNDIVILESFDNRKPNFRQYELDNNYKLSVCSDDKLLDSEHLIIQLDSKQIFRELY